MASTDLKAPSLQQPPAASGNGVAWMLILIGVALRVVLYLTNRPLWLDEAQLAVNFNELDYKELARPGVLIFNQGAPVGYLWTVKLVSMCLGTGEMALRLTALLGGIATMLVFHRVVIRILPLTTATMALGLFCVSEPMIAYSNEVKPYMIDVLVSLLYSWLALRVFQDGWRTFDISLLGVVGVATLWFSMPSIFTMAGVLSVLGVVALKQRNVRAMACIAAVGVAFLAAYYLNFTWFIAQKSATYSNMGLERYYGSGGRYMPLPPRSLTDVTWFALTPLHYFVDPGGFRAFGVAFIAAVVGLVELWRGRRIVTLMMLMPLALSIVAAAANKYPFVVAGNYQPNLDGRLSLYTVPYSIVFVAIGVTAAVRWLREYGRVPVLLAAAALFVHPGLRYLEQVMRPPGTQAVRTPLEHLKVNYRPGDKIYLHWVAQPVYRYYRHRMDLPDQNLIGLKDAIVSHMIEPDAWTRISDWKRAEAELTGADGGRVWFLFVHHPGSFSYADEKHLLGVALVRGKQLDRVSDRGVSLTLIDMSRSLPNQ